MLNYMQEMKADVCLAFSRWVLTPFAMSGKQQMEERYGRLMLIILVHSLREFLIFQMVKKISLCGGPTHNYSEDLCSGFRF